MQLTGRVRKARLEAGVVNQGIGNQEEVGDDGRDGVQLRNTDEHCSND